MQKQIIFNNQIVPYQLKISNRARRMRISVACDSSVVLTMPFTFDLGFAERFLRSKLSWVIKTLEKFKPYKNRVIFKTDRGEYLKHKQQALSLVITKINRLNQFYNFQYNKVTIKNQKTRWGSCSKMGNLNFNYKIVFLPEDQLNYLVTHELCHLAYMNHSNAFWQLVAKTIPNYRQLRKLLHTR